MTTSPGEVGNEPVGDSRIKEATSWIAYRGHSLIPSEHQQENFVSSKAQQLRVPLATPWSDLSEVWSDSAGNFPF